MVEATALIGVRPVGRAVAPPSIELLRFRYELSQRVDPVSRLLGSGQLLDLDWRVANDREQRLVAPYVVLERRDVEIADQDSALRGNLGDPRPFLELIEEGELVGEFLIDGRIGLVAAGRHVEIMHVQAIGAVAAEGDAHVTGVALVAKSALFVLLDRNARDDRDAVVALLAVDRDVPVAKAMKLSARKFGVRAFRLLQAQHVRPVLFEVSGDVPDAQPNRIDVPGGDRETQSKLKSLIDEARRMGGLARLARPPGRLRTVALRAEQGQGPRVDLRSEPRVRNARGDII